MTDQTWGELDSLLLAASPEMRQKLAEVILNFKPSDTHVQTSMRKKASKNKRSKALKPADQTSDLTRAAKRPLNSWMAFRCFYAVIFAQWQQKEISGFLTRMWQDDPFKAKWTIVAKAYSIIRDQVGKTQAPLDHFLQLVCPLVGIIEPPKYLGKMGWAMPNTETKEMTRDFFPDLTRFDAYLLKTNLSADDIVQHCQEAGYACGNMMMCKSSSSILGFIILLTVTAAADSIQPALAMASAINVVGNDNITPTFTSDLTYNFAPAQNESSVQLDESTAALLEIEENNILLAASGDSFPFNDQFDPEDLSAGLGLFFDPNDGEQFESFDMASFIDTDEFFNV
jgi:hypothetical protein